MTLWGWRLAAIGLAVLFTGLVVEGALSLLTGRSLRPRPLLELAKVMETTVASATAARGAYRTHPDPRVGFVLVSGEHEFAGAIYHAGADGMRVRWGTPRSAPIRVVVLGDSVAFGYGVTDEETLATRLERHLDAVRGEGARPIEVRTVAVPSWNYRNEVEYLLSNLASYAPDVVVYIPVANDLTDTNAVDADGALTVGSDPIAEDPLLYVRPELVHGLLLRLAGRVARGESADLASADAIGPDALTADLSRESSRRYDDNARAIVRLHDALEAMGAKLLVAWFLTDAPLATGHTWHVRRRLLESRPEVRTMALFERATTETVLDKDPHPNAAAIDAAAVWLVEALLDAEMIERGAAHPRPSVPERFERLRARTVSAAEIVARSGELRSKAAAMLQPELNVSTGRGLRQIYGGLNPDGTVGARCLAVLPGGGRSLTVEIAPIVDLPIVIDVQVDGNLVGSLTLPDDTRESYALPPTSGASPIEVRLAPSSWVARTIDAHEIVASCELVSLRLD